MPVVPRRPEQTSEQKNGPCDPCPCQGSSGQPNRLWWTVWLDSGFVHLNRTSPTRAACIVTMPCPRDRRSSNRANLVSLPSQSVQPSIPSRRPGATRPPASRFGRNAFCSPGPLAAPNGWLRPVLSPVNPFSHGPPLPGLSVPGVPAERSDIGNHGFRGGELHFLWQAYPLRFFARLRWLLQGTASSVAVYLLRFPVIRAVLYLVPHHVETELHTAPGFAIPRGV